MRKGREKEPSCRSIMLTTMCGQAFSTHHHPESYPAAYPSMMIREAANFSMLPYRIQMRLTGLKGALTACEGGGGRRVWLALRCKAMSDRIVLVVRQLPTPMTLAFGEVGESLGPVKQSPPLVENTLAPRCT